ncbi:MAG: Glutamate racemase [Myxococcota bacterium]|nr:Glutamate racemase [Myxococcota bacterium]
MSDSRPIGIFDSGVGGLTVLDAIRRELPGEDLVYLGDTARVPYGTRSARVVARYSWNNACFLRDQNIKLLVVACNTATAMALPLLHERLGLPVLGVIEPGVRMAVELIPEGPLAVIGTRGAMGGGAYNRVLEQVQPGRALTSIPCPLFVPLAEEGLTSGILAAEAVRLYLEPLRGHVRGVILGCTHYPLLKAEISSFLGPEVVLVDSSTAVAGETARLLARSGLAAGPGKGGERYFVTDAPGAFQVVGQRFLGRAIAGPELVDIQPLNYPGGES